MFVRRLHLSRPAKYTRSIFLLASLASLVAGIGAVHADDPPTVPDKAESKISPLLRDSFHIFEVPGTETRPQPPRVTKSLPQNPLPKPKKEPEGQEGEGPLPSVSGELIRFDEDGKVQVYIFMRTTNSGAIATLEELGVHVELIEPREGIIQGWVLPSRLHELAQLPSVRRISTPDYAVPKVGSVDTEADLITRSQLARDLVGLTGAGVKVGVISDGVDSKSSAQASGDLPDSIEINPLLSGAGDEGTALLEIVHDLAPAAHLAFSGVATSLEMVEAISFLANDAFGGTGVDIIVDDLAFYAEPFFADGAIAREAQKVVDAGTMYFSAAGNSAERHYEGDYVDGGDGFHAFGPGDPSLSVAFSGRAALYLQWNDEFGASGNDYDLYVCEQGAEPSEFSVTNRQCWVSDTLQDGDDDPFEGLLLTSVDVEIRHVYIRAFDADGVGRLELFINGGRVMEHGVKAGGVFGHAAAEGVIAVGAIDVSDPGHDDLQPFSDRGTAEIFFPARESRPKPDIVALDGVSVTGAGGFSSPFFGTSASAPQVAAIAALLLEAQRLVEPGVLKPQAHDAVVSSLLSNAVDLGEPGRDDIFGAGRVDALAAVDSMGLLDEVTWTVDSTGDGGDSDTGDGICDDGSGNCTLRAAIEQMNAGTGSIIEFDIAGTGPHTIQPASSLPTIAVPTIIDGGGQIELDGQNAGGSVSGLTLAATASEVRGLTINRFRRHGIVLETEGGQVIEDNLIGTDISGTTNLGNRGIGVSVSGVPSVSILRNVISGNGSHGIEVRGAGAAGTAIVGNLVGTDRGGHSELGNASSGIFIVNAPDTTIADNVISGNRESGVAVLNASATRTLVTKNFIGTGRFASTRLGNSGSGVNIYNSSTNNVVELNTIAFNGGDGITVRSVPTVGNTLWENSIHSNAGLGIDLADDGVTANDDNDDDSGPNNLQNFPVISAAAIGRGEFSILGTIDTEPSANVVLDFHSSQVCDAAASGEGQLWLGFGLVTTDDQGVANFRASSVLGNFFVAEAPKGPWITATATTADGTSEFSGCVQAQTLPTLAPSTERLTVDEGGTATYEVTLAEEPAGNVVVKFASFDADVISVSTEALTFTRGNWDQPQEVTVTGVHDADATNAEEELTHLTLVGGRTFVVANIEVVVIDDDLPVATLSHQSLTVPEGGSASFSVRLAEQPTGTVRIRVDTTQQGAQVVTMRPLVFSFTTGTWNRPRTVTVTGRSDPDALDEELPIGIMTTLDGIDHILGVLDVTVADDDLPGLMISADKLMIDEGTDGTYTVALASQPTGPVELSLISTDNGAASVDPKGLTFDATDWNVPQLVTVSGATDDDGSDEEEAVVHTTTVAGRVHVVGTVLVEVTDLDTAPFFVEGDSTFRMLFENSTPGTDIQGPVSASDPDGGPVVYTLGGTDAQSFGIDRHSGQLSVGSGVELDYEHPHDADGDNDYELVLTATDVDNESDSIDVTIIVGDDPEPSSPTYTENIAPGRPTDVTVTRAAINPHGRLSVSWTAPDNANRPPITDYDHRYRVSGAPKWKTVAYSAVTAGPVVISDLLPETGYEVQVRAINARGAGGWSAVAFGTTLREGNRVPEFLDSGGNPITSATREVAENTVAGAQIGDPVEATDADNDALVYALDGSGSASFDIATTSGQLLTRADLDHESESSFSVTVTAADRYGGADSIAITINVADVDEPPGKPDAPTVAPAQTDGHSTLAVSWSAPDTTGKPPITNYDLRYREGAAGDWSDLALMGASTEATISGLKSGTSYEFRVRATNDEGDGDWSDSSTGSTNLRPLSVSFDSASYRVKEGDSVTIMVILDPATDRDLTIPITVSERTAEATDYTLSGLIDGSLRFADGESTKSFSVSALDDSDSDNEIIDLSFATLPDGLRSGTSTTAVLTVLEDDAPAATSTVPVFLDSSGVATTTASRSVAEDSVPGTSIGTPVSATDPDGDTLAYSMAGTDAASFVLATSTGQLTTKDSLDYEAKSTYRVTVSVTDGEDTEGDVETTPTIDATVTVTINVTDADEPPGKPIAPTVAPAQTDGHNTLTVSWSAPTNTGTPIIDYELQYREGTSGNWSNADHSGATTTATISGLNSSTSYEFRVRATNDEGDGDWSDSSTGSTDMPGTVRSMAAAGDTVKSADISEEVPAQVSVTTPNGGPVTILTGSNQGMSAPGGFVLLGSAFDITAPDASADDPLSIKLTVRADVAPQYLVAFKDGTSVEPCGVGTGQAEPDPCRSAESGEVGSASVAVLSSSASLWQTAVAIPRAPDLSVTGGDRQITLSWNEPANEGPSITGYDVEFRRQGETSWSSQTVDATGRQTTIGGLSQSTTYEARVRAKSDARAGEWSDVASGSTGSAPTLPESPSGGSRDSGGGGGGGGGRPTNVAPEIDGPSTVRVRENSRHEVDTWTATDEDGDEFDWKIGGIDRELFRISSDDGAASVFFREPPDYENPLDFRADNTYEINLTVEDRGEPPKGHRVRVKITVTDINESPAVVQTVEEIALGGDTSEAIVDLAGRFSDPEDDSLIYSATVEPEGVAAVEVVGTTLTITRTGGGSGVVTVRAYDRDPTDSRAKYGELAFSATLEAPSPTPVPTPESTVEPAPALLQVADPTPTAVPMAEPTVTPPRQPVPTSTVAPAATAVPTPQSISTPAAVRPTHTAVPTPTVLTPTATALRQSTPTATSAVVIALQSPTSEPLQSTPEPSPMPSVSIPSEPATRGDDQLTLWVILAGLAVVVGAAAAAYLLIRPMAVGKKVGLED